MYSAVPPPGQVEEASSCCVPGVASEDINQEEKRKPHNVQDHQWKVGWYPCRVYTVFSPGISLLGMLRVATGRVPCYD